ncbi:alpha-tocopherol transfer protein-like [Anastrepha ludens]|uniref:alpha-tocopherol transfer protein-like n=1 Tax=Anastrepha ludens TaxID=28586 RepID=UPI0023AEEDB5|nr:alpha-tocopherol transfer protein-like [Anastrepha ludens]XP_053951153.1 alpha-tocopherol transfer protein-like [Anastrepha ludens]
MAGKQLNEKLDELEQWFKENPNLPEEIDRVLLRRFFKCMYFNMEDTKKLIELNFSLRNKNPQLFLDRDPEEDAVKAVREATDMIPLPGLTPEGYKILFYRLADSDPKKLNSKGECKTAFLLADCRFADLDLEEQPPQTNAKESNEDTRLASATEKETLDSLENDALEDNFISNGEVQICDISGYTLSHLTRISYPTLRMYMNFLQEAYPVRLRAMHIINCPSFLNSMIAIVKPFINDHVYNMIQFHTEGLDSLYEKVPRDLLPNEYGGKAGPIAELKQKWAEELKTKRDYLMDPKQWKIAQTQNARRWYWF